MKYYIYLMALYLLLSTATGTAASSSPAIDVSIPSSFVLSGTATATDNGSNEVILAGPIEFVRSSRELFVRVPAPAGNGTRLVSLDDRESGIAFRNNTMLLPLYASGTRAASLVVATGNLTAGSDGYSGPVTGMELDMPEISTVGNGPGFTAGCAIMLRDLPPGAQYRMSFAGSDEAAKAISADLKAKGLTAADMSPALRIEGVTQASNDAVSFVIITIRSDSDRSQRHNASNITFYHYDDGQLSRLHPGLLKAGDVIAYQAVAPGTGQFILVASRQIDRAIEETPPAISGDVAVLGGILAILLLALVAMVRRVRKR